MSSLVGVAVLAAVSVTAAVGAGGCHAAPGASPPTTLGLPQALSYDAVFVACGPDNAIEVINAETQVRTPSAIFLENTSFPHYMTLSHDRSKLIVTAGVVGLATQANTGAANAALALDAADGGAEDAGGGAEDGGGGAPDAGPPTGNDAGAVNEGAVLVLNAATGVTIRGAFTGTASLNTVFGPDETELWTAQGGSPGKALVLLANSLATKTTVDVQNGPTHVSISSNGRYAFVVNAGSNSVSAIDTVSKKVTSTLPVGKDPLTTAQGSNGLAYVESADKTLTAIDAQSLVVKRTYDLGFTAGAAAYGPDGSVWVTDFTNGKVVLFDANSSLRQRDIDTGAGAYGVTFSADGKKAYVSNQLANTVSVIDVPQRKVIVRIPVGNRPNWVLFRAKDKGSTAGAGDGGG
ncbi:MAG TPA: hypothetical protein VNO21_21935 [Polyangiaceae bacterium]|nr:hypothetical protein [Polyangiaceae bacterium]